MVSPRPRLHSVAENGGDPEDLCDYLVDIHDNSVSLLADKVENHVSVQFNIVLECTYGKPEPLNTRQRQNKEKLCSEERENAEKKSGWTLISDNRLQLQINKLDPIRLSYWIDLSATVKAKKVVFNRKNDD
ncbi:hypothetical protein PR048_005456 [Dryococelus australis]|uniref:Uncharacterized protein n=1 Tax=Dryococelus australis TaxID=614101 RepID=A0ABQ9I878_9NEOP|nr:hypothetical protein PR048_005456 [Dryococelus australis]